MAAAYSGATIKQDPETNEKYVRVSTSGIKPRDGALYMLHTITGADNAGLLGKLDYNIEVGVKDGVVMVEFNEL